MNVYQRLVRWLRPVRTRLTLLATGLVTLALGIAAVLMVVALHHVLLRSADAGTSARAQEISRELSSEGLHGVDPGLLATAQNIAVIQIIDRHGNILLVNDPKYGCPMSPPVAPGQELTIHGAVAMCGSEAEYQTTARGVMTPDGPLSVLVGAAEAPINSTVLTVGILCSIVFPLIVIVMALLTHYFVGRTLGPVDDIRRRVEAISGGDMAERVPVPTTGDEIATLATTMNEMLGRIEIARTQQLRFVNNASHELNSPLTTLVGLLDLSRTKNTPIDPDTVDSVMLPDALRLQRMVADLLLLARADEGGVPLRVGDVDLDEVVSAEVARLEAVTGHTIDAQIVAVRVRGDGEKLGRALRNIADNASRHTRDTLTFAMARDESAKSVTITVSDNGIGIPDDEKNRVTERFVRLDTTRTRSSGGSGLGLSIVTEIVRAHHGHVIVTDSPTGGATVGFTLPTTAWDV
ncbi:sensor histidine kinase [Gordonia sp. DT101]|uniref:sensor histidine kinase n=1 Tax=Gordonia sp. DT101 TaxID=3416545 RepID=UPI003CFB75D3